MLTVLWSLLWCRLRSRAALELEILALRHQVAVLNRQRSGRPRLSSIDRLLWIWLFRLWPRCIGAMVLVKPATVVQWHRNGFRRYWRWRSRSRCPGRPRVDRAVRDLIRQISTANPLWGAPRIHGEIRKLGIVVSQASVARCLLRRPKAPSPTWRAFLHNHAAGIAAADMFGVATATFQLLYVFVVLGHHRRKIIHLGVTRRHRQLVGRGCEKNWRATTDMTLRPPRWCR